MWAVRWYCQYGVSYRDLEEMFAERGMAVDHTTIFRWVQAYAPEIERRLRWQWKRPGFRQSWRVDETYVKVRGRWAYLYRAVTVSGETIDFYLSPTRNAKAAKRFLGKALRPFKDYELPVSITTNKAGCYGRAIVALKAEGKLPPGTEHRRSKYLNNRVEADHGALKRVIRPTLGFKTMKTAYATIRGFEVMHALRKRQGRTFQVQDGIAGQVRLIERAFGIGPDALTEAVARLNERLEMSNRPGTAALRLHAASR